MNVSVLKNESQSTEPINLQHDSITRPSADAGPQRILLIGQLRPLLSGAECGMRIDVRRVIRGAAPFRRIDGLPVPAIAQSARIERWA